MKNKHTQGNWRVVEDERNSKATLFYDKTIISAFCNLHFHKGHNIEANMKLIAAAPELLKALDNFTRVFETLKTHYPIVWGSLVNTGIDKNFTLSQAKEAIQKATE